MVSIELYLSLFPKVPRGQMEEDLQDVVFVFQVVRIDLGARNQFCQHKETDVQLILNQLILIEVRSRNRPLNVGHHLIKRCRLQLAQMNHWHGTEYLYGILTFKMLVITN